MPAEMLEVWGAEKKEDVDQTVSVGRPTVNEIVQL